MGAGSDPDSFTQPPAKVPGKIGEDGPCDWGTQGTWETQIKLPGSACPVLAVGAICVMN